jgi:hypothetical protein
MPPVRLKLYGLLAVTRRGYLLQLAVAATLLAGLLAVWLRMPGEPPGRGAPPDSPLLTFVRNLLDHLPWIVLGLGLLVALEAVIVLRRFAQLEAAQQVAPAQTKSES